MMFLTPTQLPVFVAAMLGHFVGDYLFQNQWMAVGKSQPGVKGHVACTVHVSFYTLAVALLTGWHPLFLLAVFVPHWVIDRWSLANYILWLKNRYHPKNTWNTAPLCSAGQNRVNEEKLRTLGFSAKEIETAKGIQGMSASYRHAAEGMAITVPLIQQAANNSAELQANVWRLAFAALNYAANDNTMHWLCLYLAVLWLFR